MDQIGVDGFQLGCETNAFLIERENQIADTVEHMLWLVDVSTRIVDPEGKFARLLIQQIEDDKSAG
jgi:hypothetical protein